MLASFFAFGCKATITPVEDTELVILVTMYDPQKGLYHGGQVAGPVASKIIKDTLKMIESDDLVLFSAVDKEGKKDVHDKIISVVGEWLN